LPQHPFCFAQRCFIAALILARAAALILRRFGPLAGCTSSSSRQSYHSHSLTAGSGSMPSCSAKAAITYTISRAHTLALEPSTVPAAKTLTCRKDVASCIPSEINLPCGAQIFHPTSEPTGQSEVRTEYPGSARRETQVSAFSLHGHRRFPQATWKNRRHTKTEIDDLSV
jgi:hypothetical protein